MTQGIDGFRCSKCQNEWNMILSDKSILACPLCLSEDILNLNRTVPFLLNDGLPPDHVYHCICGKIFQKQPTSFNPFVNDPSSILKQLTIQCPYCRRIKS